MYYCGFTSASHQFLLWLQDANCQLAGLSKGSVKPGVRAEVLNYAKKDSQKLFEFMYYAPNLPKLTRKHLKFVDFLRTDPYASKELLARVAEW